MAIYINYYPATLIEKAMFNFDAFGLANYKYSGPIQISVSDGFSYQDYYFGYVNSVGYTMWPYPNEVPWGVDTKNNIQETLNILSSFAKFSFSTVVDYDVSANGAYSIASPANVGILSDINITFMSANSAQLLGESSGPMDNFGYFGSRGDIFINMTATSFIDGINFSSYSKSRQVLMHELLHSLGLSHPFGSRGVTEDYWNLLGAGFQDLGFIFNSGQDINKEYFSIMSYDDQSSISNINAYTPMILDVIALQGAYGEGSGTTGTANDVISAGTVGYRTYFDKGGVDTVDISAYASGCYLNMGVEILGASHLVGLITNQSDAINLFSGLNPQSLRWLYGEYENATGSAASDWILGNRLNNSIQAGDGDDFISGGAGNDVIDGGAGDFDTCIFNLALANYKITKANGVFAISAIGGVEGADKVRNVEYFKFFDQTLAASDLIDTTPPTVTIEVDRISLGIGDVAKISFTLSETSTDFSKGDITVSGGTINNFSGSGRYYSAIFYPKLNSKFKGSIVVASGVFSDGSGNFNNDGADQDNSQAIEINTFINSAPSGALSIIGSARQFETLQLRSTLIDADGLGTIYYQWKANDIDIDGATSTTYKLTQASVGKKIAVTASYVDGMGSTEVVISASTDIVTNINDTPSGIVAISGNAIQGAVLSATHTLEDADGLGVITYTWTTGGVQVHIGAVYTLSQDDVGKQIRVSASYVDQYGITEYAQSVATSAVANVNDTPVGSIEIAGSPIRGNELTARNSVSDIDGISMSGVNSFKYQWQAKSTTNQSWSDIVNASKMTYLLQSGDLGKSIRLKVTYTDGGGTLETVASDATVVVTNVNSKPTGILALSGPAAQGGELTVENSVKDADEIPVAGSVGALTYAWFADGRLIEGESSAKLLLKQSHVGKKINVVALYTDLFGTSESVESLSTVAVTNVNDKPIGLVAISGSPSEGRTLVASNTLIDPDGLSDITYIWKTGGRTVGTGATYVLGKADVGKSVSVTAGYKDGYGTEEAVSSDTVRVTSRQNAAPTGLVSISGFAVQGEICTASSNLDDLDGLGTIAYQWNADGKAIKSATSQNFILTQSEVGKTITVTASYTDGFGKSESITSNGTIKIANTNDSPTGTILITGSPTSGQVLTSINSLSDLDGLGTLAYQWQSSGNGSTWVAISGATKTSYELGRSDVSKFVRLNVSYKDKFGALESANSAPTTLVVKSNEKPTGLPAISGKLVEGESLTADISKITDLDGLGSITYSWQISSDKKTWVDGSNSVAYKLGKASAGWYVQVIARYTDGYGTVETVKSAVSSSIGSKDFKIVGTASADTLDGMSGVDIINGLEGDDILDGGAGNDLITGGVGADLLKGGLGKDTFIYTGILDSIVSTPDLVIDFTKGDKIDLKSIDADTSKTRDQEFKFSTKGPASNSVWWDSASSTLFGDINADANKTPDFAVKITLVGVTQIVATDVVL